MISYPYIEALFRNVLLKSKAIEGRFFVCPRAGAEINSDSLQQLLSDAIIQQPGKKYPCVLMVPPRSLGDFTDKQVGWERYKISTFWMRSSYHDNGTVATVNPNTQTSLRPVLEDWSDMKACAMDFLRTLEAVMRKHMMQKDTFRVVAGPRPFVPVTLSGVDNASGVRLDFEVELNAGCNVTDYTSGAADRVTLPGFEPDPYDEEEDPIDRSNLKFYYTFEVQRLIVIDLRRTIGDQSATMDWGDGTIDESTPTAEVIFQHTYQPGTYEATLTLVTGVTDPEARLTNSVTALYIIGASGGFTTRIGPSLSKCYNLKFFQAIGQGLTDFPNLPVWRQGSDEPYEQIRSVNLSENNLTGDACSRVFIGCNKAGWSVGYVDLTGSPGLSELTTLGAAARDSLIAKHWTVNL